ncbi:MAG: hypothetical protein QOF72_254, partial [Blastocatellia bacterium]|nr:hypothetical protein [Blastocatellia bacterium]
MRILSANIFIILALSGANAQGVDSSRLSGTYWLRYSLIFFHGCQPIVSPTNIIFTEGDCSTDAYSGKILPRGTEVSVTSIRQGKQFAIVSFNHGSIEYQVAFANRSKKTLHNALNLLLTKKTLDEFYETRCPDNVKTKRQLIRCIGFPISVTRDGDFENYFYIIEFVGPNLIGGSFDGFNVKIRRNRILGVSG